MADSDMATEREADTSATASATAEPDATTPALVGEGLQVGYPSTDEPVVACDRVLLPAGEVTALVGPNGSGKSTLLQALAGQLEPWAGTVQLGDVDVYAMEGKRRARSLGLLTQEGDTPDSLTVEELVRHGRYPHRGFLETLSEADHAAVERALSTVGITALRGDELGNLSGGQQQLARVAMTLAQKPDVLLLDEPTTFLDLRHQLGVLDAVRELNHEGSVTVGIVLHDIAQAARYADNLIALRDGTPYDWGPPADVVTEELLAEVFGVDATVREGARGRPPPAAVTGRRDPRTFLRRAPPADMELRLSERERRRLEGAAVVAALAHLLVPGVLVRLARLAYRWGLAVAFEPTDATTRRVRAVGVVVLLALAVARRR